MKTMDEGEIFERLIGYKDQDVKDAIVRAIVKQREIKKALATVAGKTLFCDVIYRMENKIEMITEMCLSSSIKPDDLKKLAREVYECKLLLKDWATILNTETGE